VSSYVFPAALTPSVAVAGQSGRYPVHRIYCVGRNYAEHVREMGADPAREPPIFFMKPADAVIASGERVPYPPRTDNFHHEIELVIAIGRAGRDIASDAALDYVFGYAVGNDFTRRDLQAQARKAGLPWDTSKGFDHSAGIAAIRPVSAGHIRRGRIWLSVNGTLRQDSDVAEMIWSVPEIIAQLSTLFTLSPGDLIYSGTPAGVGPLVRGDVLEGGVEGLQTLVNTIA
jgi:fumarylpyruvate hydrolase